MNTRKTTRRNFLAGIGAAAAAAGLARPVVAQGKPKLVVIGGGPGGATVAKYVARDSQGAIDVTLVEPAREFTTCFHSNLYLGGFRSFESITHTYDALASKYGIRHARQMASAVDRNARTVRLADGTTLNYEDKGSPDAPPLILLHGFPLNLEMWRAQIDGLARFHRVVAPDFRGFGKSAEAGPFTIESLESNILAGHDGKGSCACATCTRKRGGARS